MKPQKFQKSDTVATVSLSWDGAGAIPSTPKSANKIDMINKYTPLIKDNIE